MTLDERRAHLLALEREHTIKKAVNECYARHQGIGDVFERIAARFSPHVAEDARRALADGGGKRPWTSAELARLYTAIREQREEIAKLEAAIGPMPKRETVIGNGWMLIDDTQRGLIVLWLSPLIRITQQLKFTFRGERFTYSKHVGYNRERSAVAWERGLALGRVIEGGGERTPDATDDGSASTAQ